jgi:hypothetical protein
MTLGSHEIVTTCPWCRETFDMASNGEIDMRKSPTPSDATLCIKCGEWSVFTRRLKLRKPTDAEFAEIAASKQHRDLRLAWLLMKATEASAPKRLQ